MRTWSTSTLSDRHQAVPVRQWRPRVSDRPSLGCCSDGCDACEHGASPKIRVPRTSVSGGAASSRAQEHRCRPGDRAPTMAIEGQYRTSGGISGGIFSRRNWQTLYHRVFHATIRVTPPHQIPRSSHEPRMTQVCGVFCCRRNACLPLLPKKRPATDGRAAGRNAAGTPAAGGDGWSAAPAQSLAAPDGGQPGYRGPGHDASSRPVRAGRRAAQLPRYSDFISSALAGRTPIAREPDADAPCACAP